MALSYSQLNSIIRQIENSELFNRLFREVRIIRYKRFDRTDISPGYLPLDEFKLIDNTCPEVESILENNRNTIDYIRTIGVDKFKKYFLLVEEALSEKEIALACDIPLSWARAINNLVNETAVMEEFYSVSSLNSNSINYTKIAAIEREVYGLRINYFSKSLARGRYIIDYDNFEEYAAEKCTTEKEIRAIRALFKKLEMVNICKDTLHMVLVNLIQKQSAYIDSGRFADLLPLSQKEMALKLGINASRLSRAVKFKTIELPCGREVTLKSLFPNPRKFRMSLVKQVLQSENRHSSDTLIQSELADKYGINISRRTVANMRNELKIPAGGKR